MICPYCGTNVDDSASVCPACNAKLDSEGRAAAEAAETIVKEAETAAAQPEVAAQSADPAMPAAATISGFAPQQGTVPPYGAAPQQGTIPQQGGQPSANQWTEQQLPPGASWQPGTPQGAGYIGGQPGVNAPQNAGWQPNAQQGAAWQQGANVNAPQNAGWQSNAQQGAPWQQSAGVNAPQNAGWQPNSQQGTAPVSGGKPAGFYTTGAKVWMIIVIILTALSGIASFALGAPVLGALGLIVAVMYVLLLTQKNFVFFYGIIAGCIGIMIYNFVNGVGAGAVTGLLNPLITFFLIRKSFGK